MLILKKWLSPVCRLVGGATKIKFPFVYEEVDGLGRVFLPLVTAGVWFPENETWIDFQFIVDTGSTATILPSYIADQMGINLEKLEEINMSGVEGTGVKSWLSKIKIKLAEKEICVDCFFVDNPEVPFLLGRAGLVKKFSLIFDSRKELIIFKRNV